MSDTPESPNAEQLERLAGIKRILEALLFSSDRPVGTRQLAEAAGAADGHEARSLLKEMQSEYDEQGRAFALEEVAGGFQLMSRPQFAPYISRLHDSQQQESLSKAALETLAIVAYRQPITRAEIEDIRGVQCGPVLRGLVDRRLLRVTGRSEELGRPLLYGTTSQFLQAFGLSSLSELPKKPKLAQPSAPRADGPAGPA
jgi:segregation and condensation protein B